MKEFHKALGKAKNKSQFIQICKDAFTEMNFEHVSCIDSMLLFNDYYNLNFTLLELARMGKFIKTGDYKQQLELYC